jgi:hypothetical protein
MLLWLEFEPVAADVNVCVCAPEELIVNAAIGVYKFGSAPSFTDPFIVLCPS